MTSHISPASGTPRRIVVFGASGGVGRQVAEQALARGHEVVAVVRTPGKLDLSDQRLSVVPAGLDDRQAIEAAVRGADAVISALGPSLDRKATGMPLIEGTQNIVDAMGSAGVQRYVGMATPSVRDPRDGRALMGIVVPLMGRLFLARAYRELLGMSRIVIDSGLDWTIARFIAPRDGPAKGTVRAGFLGRQKLGSAITRADIATFLLDQIDDPRFVRAAPAISN